jgi:hypothetical protein
MSELTGSSVETRMMEIERAARNSEAQDRLSQIRAELGIGTSTETPAVEAGSSDGGDGSAT